MSHYETATSGRKPIARENGAKVAFKSSANEKAHAKLLRHELIIRRETLERNIRLHEHDVNPDRDLAHLIINWRKELLELKCLGL